MQNDLSRRRFHQLAVAAFGGVLAGTVSGCGNSEQPTADKPTAPAVDTNVAVNSDLHVCRGLNTCKGKGKDGKNECAGTGICATFAQHDCAGSNECKGQGGCGANPGQNECKGKGGCHVPLMDHAWGKARKALEEKLKADGKEVGAAPEAV